MIICLIFASEISARDRFLSAATPDSLTKSSLNFHDKIRGEFNVINSFGNYLVNSDSTTKGYSYAYSLGLNFKLYRIPFKIGFNYSNADYASHISNVYFQLDKDCLVKEKIPVFTSTYSDLSHKSDSINSLIADLKKKREFLLKKSSVETNFLNTFPLEDSSLIPSIDTSKLQFEDSIKLEDSLNLNEIHIDSNSTFISKEHISSYSNSIDSIDKIITDLEYYESKLNREKEEYNFLSKQTKYPNKFVEGRRSKILSNIKDFGIGKIFPSNGEFLVNGIGILGLNLAFENAWNVSLIAGFSDQLQYFSPKLEPNLGLKSVIGFSSLNDFNNQYNLRLVSVKGGPGKVSGTHFHAGFLAASTNGSLSSNNLVDNFPRNNFVAELDLAVFLKHNFDFTINSAKSFSRSTEQSSSNEINSYKMFDRYSNASYFNINKHIEKTKTSLKLKVKYVDGYFRSFGVANSKNDYLNCNIQLRQVVSKKIKFSLGVTNLYSNIEEINAPLVLSKSYNSNFSYKINRRLNLNYSSMFGSYSVDQEVESINSSFYNHNILLIWMPKPSKILKHVVSFSVNEMGTNFVTTRQKIRNFHVEDNMFLLLKNQFGLTVGMDYINFDSKSKSDFIACSLSPYFSLTKNAKVSGSYRIMGNFQKDYYNDYSIDLSCPLFKSTSMVISFRKQTMIDQFSIGEVAQSSVSNYLLLITLNYIF